MLLTQGCAQTALDSNEAQQPGQFVKWRHSGTMHIITTPEGADLPAAATEKDFPLLVRLDKDFFDFSQAKDNGEDIRFSAEGKALSYQIEEWDAAGGTASIWVRIPEIRGNAVQAITMHWGNSGASTESNGSAVFNTSNGFLSVFHLDSPTENATGGSDATNYGSSASRGRMGSGRYFEAGQYIRAGNLSNYPSGSEPHTLSAWFRAEATNAAMVAWGNETKQGKAVLLLQSPRNFRVDAWFSNGDLRGTNVFSLNEWVHAVFAYQSGSTRLYINGASNAENNSTGTSLNVLSPSRLEIGSWYEKFNYVGDIDEVRFSSVTRSADWVKLEYENQKPFQALAGWIVPAGGEFSVSQTSATVQEGDSINLTANAGGAQKIYWILKRDDVEKVVAVDRLSYRFDAGRVTGNSSCTLQFKAVYANEVKTRDTPVTITEDIPDPAFTLRAPSKWNGRDTIEVVPSISNLKAMAKKDSGNLAYKWNVSGGAVIKEVLPAKLILKRSQCSGKITVSLALNNGGAAITQTATITVKEPGKDAWVYHVPAKDEKPTDNQFYARDDKNEGTLHYNGTLDEAADSVFLKVYAGDKLYDTQKQKVSADKTYALSAKLKVGLVKYRIEFGTKKGNNEKVLDTVKNLVCGDAYVIQGQSNAEAWTDPPHRVVHPYRSDWLRSFGTPNTHPDFARTKIWGNAFSLNIDGNRNKLQIGYWGVELGKQLIEQHKVPIFIINGAQGGTRVDQHQRNPEYPEDVKTIYGRLLWRLRQARLTHGIRGVLWHQGENDQGAAGPTGRYGWETYQQYFVDMSAAWKQDYPNIRHYYIFQIWPKACAMGINGSDNMLREVQRTLPSLYSNMSVMSTLGIIPPGTCHYPPEGYAVMAHLICPLMERDNYGKIFSRPITPTNLKAAYYTSARQDEIALEFDQNMIWTNSLTSEFYLDGVANNIASGTVSGKVIILKLKKPSSAQKITYLDSKSWSQDRLLYGENGIAALTFCNIPISKNSAAR